MSANTYPLSLNGDTFNALKSDYDQVLRKMISKMQYTGAEDGVLTVKVDVHLEKDQIRDLAADESGSLVDVVKPTFKHCIKSVIQAKDQKSGSLGGKEYLVWDEELGDYVLRTPDNGQTSMFDENGNGKVYDADYQVVEGDPDGMPPTSLFELPDPEAKNRGNQPSREQDSHFEYMKQFIGAKLVVLEGIMGVYTVRTEDGKVVLSSAFPVTDRFYCSPQKLAPHVGHSIICIGSPSDEEQFDSIGIWCEDCDELLFDIEAPADEPEEEIDRDKEPLDAFNWLMDFNGQPMKVLEAMGNYTVRTESNKVVLTSVNPQALLYCSGSILGPHVGHKLVCEASGPVDEYPDTISIICEECDETLFELHSPAWIEGEDEDPGDGYLYEDPDEEG